MDLRSWGWGLLARLIALGFLLFLGGIAAYLLMH